MMSPDVPDCKESIASIPNRSATNPHAALCRGDGSQQDYYQQNVRELPRGSEAAHEQ